MPKNGVDFFTKNNQMITKFFNNKNIIKLEDLNILLKMNNNKYSYVDNCSNRIDFLKRNFDYIIFIKYRFMCKESNRIASGGEIIDAIKKNIIYLRNAKLTEILTD